MARTTSYGNCALCGYRSNKAGMTRHLKTCAPEHDGKRGRAARLFHLRAEGDGAPRYWLDLEIKAGATLVELDRFLRTIWLECCGHLSMFKVGNTHYNLDHDEEDGFEDDLESLFEGFPVANRELFEELRARQPKERDMDVPLAEVLESGLRFSHEYDFGSTTYLKLKVSGEREGRIGGGALRLLARNEPLEWSCRVCGKPATQLHTEEMWNDDNPFYCEVHAEAHEDDWAFMPVVNSPRMGVCGYTGAA
jgi:hypothetical protein